METFEEVLRRWTDAEARGDTAALDGLLHEDFRGDGPLGFVFGKDQWLDRYRKGELVTDTFEWTASIVRVSSHTAVARGTQSQVATYCGMDCSGDFLCTVVAVRRDDRWTIVNVQLSRHTSKTPGIGVWHHPRHRSQIWTWRLHAVIARLAASIVPPAPVAVFTPKRCTSGWLRWGLAEPSTRRGRRSARLS